MFRRFLSDTRGVIALIFGLALIPVIIAIGVAIDYARGSLLQNKISAAIDAAGLAAGRAAGTADLEDVVETFFDANFDTDSMPVRDLTTTVTTDGTTGEITVTSSANLDTSFLKIVGIEEIPVSATTVVSRTTYPIDLVFSIDISGSMNESAVSGGTRIEAAKTAANTLLDTLYGVATTSTDILIGIVPWASMVDVTDGSVFTGTTAVDVDTFTNPINGETQTEIYMANNSQVPLLFEPPSNWKGCVYARYIDGQPDIDQGDAQDLPDTYGIMDWVAWEPPGADTSGSDPDPPSSKKKKKKGKKKKKKSHLLPDFDLGIITTAHASGGSDNSPCPDSKITPMRHDKAGIVAALEELSAGGATNMAQGLVWAWRVLMPGAPFIEAEPVSDPPPYRAIVILSDGAQVGTAGDAYKGVFGTNSSARDEMDDRLRLIAAAIKAQGINIYAIQFANGSSELQDLMEEIATEPNSPYYHYAPDGDALEDIFELIGHEVAKLRIVR